MSLRTWVFSIVGGRVYCLDCTEGNENRKKENHTFVATGGEITTGKISWDGRDPSWEAMYTIYNPLDEKRIHRKFEPTFNIIDEIHRVGRKSRAAMLLSLQLPSQQITCSWSYLTQKIIPLTFSPALATRMLEEMEDDLDTATTNLSLVTLKTKELIQKSGGKRNFILIVLLTVVVVVLLFLVIYT
jgi:hypothetical protein